jgi:hypothetical protein
MMGRALSVQGDTRGLAGSSQHLLSNAAKADTPAPDAATRDFPARLHVLRRCFPGRWASFLRAHFQCPAHVAAFFDVDAHTAHSWWNGKHGVNSAPVIYAMQRIPGAVAELLEVAA